MAENKIMEQTDSRIKAYYRKQLGEQQDRAVNLSITKDAAGISEAEKVLYGLMNETKGMGLIPFGEFHLLPPNVTSVRCQGVITISRLQRVQDGDFAASPFNLSYATKYGCNDKGLPDDMKRGFLRELYKGIERDGKEILAPVDDIPSTAFDTATGCLFQGANEGKIVLNENSLFCKEPYDPSHKGKALPTWVLSLSEETLDSISSNPGVRARFRERRQALAKKLGAQFGENSFELIYVGLISILYFEEKPEAKRDAEGNIVKDVDVNYKGNGKVQIYSPYGVVYARPVKQVRRGRERIYGFDAILAMQAAMAAGKRVMYTPEEEGIKAAAAASTDVNVETEVDPEGQISVDDIDESNDGGEFVWEEEGEEGLDAAFADPSGFYSDSETTEPETTATTTNDFDALAQEMLASVIAAEAAAEAAKAEVEALKAELATAKADNASLQAKVKEQEKEMANMKRGLVTDEELAVIKKVVAIFASDGAN